MLAQRRRGPERTREGSPMKRATRIITTAVIIIAIGILGTRVGP